MGGTTEVRGSTEDGTTPGAAWAKGGVAMTTKATKAKPWGNGGDSIYKRGRSWVLDFRHKGQRSILTERLALTLHMGRGRV